MGRDEGVNKSPVRKHPWASNFQRGADEDKQCSNAHCRATPLSKSLASRPSPVTAEACFLSVDWPGRLALLGNALIQ